jgi:URI fold toxin 2
MKIHANSHDNDALHHLYEIFDVERDAVFKYGISGRPLLSDGSSPRADEQINLYNRVVGMKRFFARIILTDIEGRKTAEIIENEYISSFISIYGEKPKGNL